MMVWQLIPNDIFFHHILVHCSIDIRLAFCCKPRKLEYRDDFKDIEKHIKHKRNVIERGLWYFRQTSIILPLKRTTAYYEVHIYWDDDTYLEFITTLFDNNNRITIGRVSFDHKVIEYITPQSRFLLLRGAKNI